MLWNRLNSNAGLFVFDTDPDSGTGSGGAPTTPPQTPPASKSENDQPDYKTLAAEWQKRATGWQQSYERLKTQNDSLAGNYTALDADHRKTLADLESLAAKHNELTTNLSTLDSDAKKTRGENDRLKLIMKQFPNLMSFVDEISLFPEEGEALSTRLSQFQEKLKGANPPPAAPNNLGATPPPPESKDGSVAASAEDLFKQARTALMEGKSAEYTKLMDQYYQKLTSK